MFRLTTPRSSLFDPTVIVPGILSDADRSFIYRDKIYPLIDEEKFRHLFSEAGGAPDKSVRTQIPILIFMGIEGLNRREAEFQFSRRSDRMIATHTPFGEANIDHTTLFKFYQRSETDDAAYELFKNLTARFISECNVYVGKQRTDSFFMHGWLERLSRYGLFKETDRVFLQNLRKQKPGLYENIRAELSRDYLEKEFDLTEKDKDKTNRKVQETANDLYLLKNAFENHHQVKHYESFKISVTVFEQQCLVKEASSEQTKKEEIAEIRKKNEKGDKGTAGAEIEIRKIPEGEKIISSPHNTDAEYTKKRDQKTVGHKGFVTETCDPANEVQFITDVNSEGAKHADSEEISEIENRSEDNGLKPEKLYGDAGFVNGESISESEARGIDLSGPSSGRSQSKEEYAGPDRPIDIADFKVLIDNDSEEISVLSCPKGQTPTDQSRSEKTGQISVHFKSSVCSQCELKDRCPIKIGVVAATLTISEAQYAGAARHHRYMEDAGYRKECGIRAGAESMVNETANGHGAGKARHRTEKRCRLQLIFASIGCNVKRFINYVVKCVPNQTEMVENMA